MTGPVDEYLVELRAALSGMTVSEREEIVDEIRAHIAERSAQPGMTITEILQLMRKNKYKFPAAIELEYTIPAGSDGVTEVGKCVEYCKKALA